MEFTTTKTTMSPYTGSQANRRSKPPEEYFEPVSRSGVCGCGFFNLSSRVPGFYNIRSQVCRARVRFQLWIRCGLVSGAPCHHIQNTGTRPWERERRGINQTRKRDYNTLHSLFSSTLSTAERQVFVDGKERKGGREGYLLLQCETEPIASNKAQIKRGLQKD